MGWADKYATNHDANAYATWVQFWAAIRERHMAISGSGRWPRPNVAWANGTITGLTTAGTNLTMTDSSAHWIVTDPYHVAAKRWTDWDVTHTPSVPTSYDVVLNADNPDPTKHIQLPIIDNDETTLTVHNFTDAITAGWIGSVGEPIGTSYAIIRRGGLWWGDRWPDHPNDEEIWKGSAAGCTIVFDTAASYLAGQFIGKLFRRSGHTDVNILDNGPNYLLLDWQSTLPTGSYTVIDAGAVVATGSVTSKFDAIYAFTYEGVPFGLKGSLIGKHLMIYGGPLRRITITDNNANVIWFDHQSSAVSGAWCVVKEGGRAWPGRLPGFIHQWYGGATQAHYTHRADDLIYQPGLSITPMPAITVRYSSGSDEAFCEDVTVNAFDIDLWSGIDEVCSLADLCRSPNLFKTLRALQNEVLDLCLSFVPTAEYNGAPAIPFYTPATLFERAAINFVGRYTATANSDGNYTFTFPAQPADPHWTILDFDGNVVLTGQSNAGGSISNSGGYPGKVYTLVVALGWTRYKPRWFEYAYPRSAFIPDIQTSEFGDQSVVDPPTPEYPGGWIERNASGVYHECEPFGFSGDGGAAFETGARARYIGDSWGGPGIVPHTTTESPPLDTLYYRNMWEGKFTKAWLPAYNAMKVGFIAYVGGTWLRMKAGTNWWNSPIGAEVMRSEVGVATGGSSSTLTLAAKYYTPSATDDDPTPDPQPDPFWAGDRYVTLILEVSKTVSDVDDNDQTITYKTPITGVSTTPSPNPTTSTVTFMPVAAYVIPAVLDEHGAIITAEVHAPALSVAEGDSFVIREPAYRRNWWMGRTVEVTRVADGVKASRLIRLSDDNTLWLESAFDFEIAAGDTFIISELAPGSVYEWNGTKWIAPTDNTKKLPLPNLLEKNDKRYGPVMMGDYVGQHVAQELAKTINLLVWTKTGVGWSSRSKMYEDVEGVVANALEITVFDPSDGSPSGGKDDVWPGLLSAYQGMYDDGTYTVSESSGPPYFAQGAALEPDGSGITARLRIVCATVDPVDCGMNREVDVFSLAWIDEANTDPGSAPIISGPDADGNRFIAYNDTYFDPHGSAMQWRNYAKWLTFSGTDDKFKSNYVGSATTYIPPPAMPHPWSTVVTGTTSPPVDPNGFGGVDRFSGRMYAGFVVVDSRAIVRWNVTGGMTYV